MADLFWEYWENNRSFVARDAAQLFTGSRVSNTITVGCSYLNDCMRESRSPYGINYIFYTTFTDLQKYLGKFDFHLIQSLLFSL